MPTIFFGTLGPKTRGCLDLNDYDTPCRHSCTASPGIFGEQPFYDDHDGPLEARWELGNQVRMVQSAPPGGPYHSSVRVAEAVDPLLDLPLWEPKTGNKSPCAWDTLTEGVLQAGFQWKGTDAELTFTCPNCELACYIFSDFIYYVACPRCQQEYAVDYQIPVRRLV